MDDHARRQSVVVRRLKAFVDIVGEDRAAFGGDDLHENLYKLMELSLLREFMLVMRRYRMLQRTQLMTEPDYEASDTSSCDESSCSEDSVTCDVAAELYSRTDLR